MVSPVSVIENFIRIGAEMAKKKEEKELVIPRHVAIILDGNGRWAKKRFLPRTAGHAVGAKNLEKVCRIAYEVGIQYLTVYAFSTENWNRSKEEVDTIMKLLDDYLNTCIQTANENDMCCKVIGEIGRLKPEMQEKIIALEEATKDNPGLHFNIAINYGGRDELVRAARHMMADAKVGLLDETQFDESVFASYLDTKDSPDPDLLIRTSGEERLSNFLLWQLAYTEFYFTDVLWPDFDKAELMRAIEKYNTRERRFGGVKQ